MNAVQLWIIQGSYQAVGANLTLYFNAVYNAVELPSAVLVPSGTLGQVATPFTVTRPYRGQVQAIPNALISARQGRLVVDRAYTDASGQAYLFLASGSYDVEVVSSTYRETYKGYTLTTGLTPYTLTLQGGRVLGTAGDTALYDNGYLRVTGQLQLATGQPWPSGEIVVSLNNAVAVDYVADAQGYYDFVLATGTYDVRLRGPQVPVKQHHGLTLTATSGFFSQLVLIDPAWQEGGVPTWTSS